MVSILGIISGFTSIAIAATRPICQREECLHQGLGKLLLFATVGVFVVLAILFLVMWILLVIKTGKKDVIGIEKIAKVYNYSSGFLEILGMIFLIIVDGLSFLPGPGARAQKA